MDTPQSLAAQISTEIKMAMAAAGMSQRDVALKSAIPLATLSRRLTGGKPFDVAELAAVSNVLDLSVVELMLRAERAVPNRAA